MLFAFGRSEGRYYISNGKRNYWKNVPNSLARHLEKEHVLQAISFGVGDTWFFKEASRRDGSSYYLSSAAAVYYPRVHEIYQSDEAINWVAFGPREQYVVDTQKRLYHSNTGKEMVRQYKDGGTVSLRCASFGHDGAWVCVEDDGVIWSSGLSAKVQAALDKKAVRNVQLSANSPTIFFIEYVDGDTAWNMPSSWSSDIESIVNISVRLDDPGVPGERSVSQRIIFAFGHEIGTFCILNGPQAAWMGIDNSNVTTRLERARTMEAFSLGENGAWFWRQGGSSTLSGATKTAYPEVWRIWKSDEEINWVAFGPQGYWIVATESHIYASRSDTILRNYKTGKRVLLRCGSFGYGGAWVVVEDDGVIRSSGLSKEVLKKVKIGNVRNVQLSITHPDEFYIEYMDGTSDWTLPKSWHDDVSKIEGNLPKPSTASNNTNTGTQYLELIPADEDNRQAAPEPEPPNLCCPICLNTFCRPVATLCMHIFCDECIYDVLRHGSLSCPLCRATITEPPEPDTILDRYLEQMIADGAVTGPSGGRSSPYTWRDVNFPQH